MGRPRDSRRLGLPAIFLVLKRAPKCLIHLHFDLCNLILVPSLVGNGMRPEKMETHSDAAAAATARRERLRRMGLAIGWTIGGVGAGIMALVLPFVTPAFRRFVLPYVPATPVQLESVLGHVRGRVGRVVDLGSGDGRVVSR